MSLNWHGIGTLAAMPILDADVQGQAVRHLLLGLMAHLKEDETQAIDHFMECNALWGEHWLPYERIAWCALLHGTKESRQAARHAIQRCAGLNPGEPEVMITQASLALADGKEEDEARELLQALVKHRGIRKVSRDRAEFALENFQSS
jgi:hypothetical protein